MNFMQPISNDKKMQEFIKVLYESSGVIYAVLALLALQTGLRISDLLKLKYGAFLPRKRILEVKESKTDKKKTIKVTPEMKKPLREMQKKFNRLNSDYIFTNKNTPNKPVHRSTVYRHFRHAGSAIGLSHIGPHSMRKSYAIELFTKSGGNVDYVKEKLNHKYASTTLKSYILSGIPVEHLVSFYEAQNEK